MERQRKENRELLPTDSFLRIDHSYGPKVYDISNKVSNKDTEYISCETTNEERFNSITNKLNQDETIEANETLPLSAFHLRILNQSQQLKPPVRTLLKSMNETPPYRCQSCERTFTTKSGRTIHGNHCKNKMVTTSKITVREDEVLPVQKETNAKKIEQDTTFRPAYIWGNHTKDELTQIVDSIYEEIVFWKKNIFMLPSGSAGKNYIREKTKLINVWNNNCIFLKDIALKTVMIMSSLLLQKPSFKAKSKEHSISLARRLNLWKEGDFDALVREARAIQSTLSANKKFKTPEQLSRTFSKLMLQGKVNAALRVLDEESSGGILPQTNTVFQDLQSKHPLSQPANESVMIKGDMPFVDPAIFSNIDETTIEKCAMKTKGAAGPSGLDAIGWRRMLVSQNYGLAGKDLCKSIAAMERNLSTRKVEINNSTTNIEVI